MINLITIMHQVISVSNCNFFCFTIYIGEPHIVAAITPSSKNRANPKSAESKFKYIY